LNEPQSAEGWAGTENWAGKENPPHLVAGWSRSPSEHRSLYVRGSRAAKLRQLVFPSRQGLPPDHPRGALAATWPLRHQLEGTPVMGTMTLAAGTHLAATTTASKGNPEYTFLILAVLIGLFYFLIMRPQRNRQRKAMATQSQVMPGQRVRTTAGMYGTVVSGDDRDVVIEIAPGVQVTMLRRAIMEVVDDDQSLSDPIDDVEQHSDNQGDEWDVKNDDWNVKDETPSDDLDLKDRNA
jgi:preprotein translocase subunit YajC